MQTAGGNGLNLQAARDAVKVVAPPGTCSSPAAAGHHTVTDKDLGPDESSYTSTATATLTFKVSGSYTVCYKLFGKPWEEVSPPLVVLRSNDTQLATLVLTPTTATLDTPFTPTKSGYAVTVPYAVAIVTVNTTPAHPNAKLQARQEVNSGVPDHMRGHLTPLQPSTQFAVMTKAGSVTEVEVKVSAEDGKTSQTYEIFITRKRAGCESIGGWKPWGACLGQCETGVATRTRVVFPESCSGSVETQRCKRDRNPCTDKVKASTALTGITKTQFEAPNVKQSFQSAIALSAGSDVKASDVVIIRIEEIEIDDYRRRLKIIIHFEIRVQTPKEAAKVADALNPKKGVDVKGKLAARITETAAQLGEILQVTVTSINEISTPSPPPAPPG